MCVRVETADETPACPILGGGEKSKGERQRTEDNAPRTIQTTTTANQDNKRTMKTRKAILLLAAAMGSLALTATSAQAEIVGQLGILDEAWFAANPINPDSGAPWEDGDTYHLAFTTVATVTQNTGGTGQSATDAMWADIANWDAVVQAEGDTVGGGAGASVTWKVIGSTATVDARDHAVVSGPVYTMQGLPLASNYADMWDGSVANEITHIDGTSISSPSYAGLVWTGSLNDGTKSGNPLGDTDRFVDMGDPIANSGPVGSQWMRYTAGGANQDHWRPASVYGLSEALQVTVVPEPSTFALAASSCTQRRLVLK